MALHNKVLTESVSPSLAHCFCRQPSLLCRPRPQPEGQQLHLRSNSGKFRQRQELSLIVRQKLFLFRSSHTVRVGLICSRHQSSELERHQNDFSPFSDWNFEVSLLSRLGPSLRLIGLHIAEWPKSNFALPYQQIYSSVTVAAAWDLVYCSLRMARSWRLSRLALRTTHRYSLMGIC